MKRGEIDRRIIKGWWGHKGFSIKGWERERGSILNGTLQGVLRLLSNITLVTTELSSTQLLKTREDKKRRTFAELMVKENNDYNLLVL